jgi:hypothetical protein
LGPLPAESVLSDFLLIRFFDGTPVINRWRKNVRIALSLGLMALFVTAGYLRADDKPKYTVKEVMKECKPKGVIKKVLAGEGTDADKKKTLELFQALAAAKPKGDADSWKKFNDPIVAAAKDVVDGKDGAVAALKKAANCSDCHAEFKGK